MTTREAAQNLADNWIESGAFERDLAALVAIPSESQTPGRLDQMHQYLREGLIPRLTRLGLTARITDNPEPGAPPFLVAERVEDPDLPTILLYGHGDVVNGQAGLWAEGRDPFALTPDGDRLYGRGTADNKVQHLINLAALGFVLEARGRIGLNLRLLVEMGEEVGSPGLVEFASSNRDVLRADALIASDGPRLDPSIPTIFTGSRGALNFSLVVELREGAHHSGNWGGLLADPAQILAHALATITGPTGGLSIPEWRPDSLTPDIRALLRGLPVGGGGPEISEGWGEPDLSPAERVFGWNSFAVRALHSGVPEAPQNAIAGRAEAACQLRFVVGTNAEDLLPSLRRHLDAHGLSMVRIVEEGAPAPATRLDPDNIWVRRIAASFRESGATDIHILPNLGGFIPNHVFSEILDMPTIWVPHSYAGCSQHAPDEHVLRSLCRDAVRLMTGAFWDLGAG